MSKPVHTDSQILFARAVRVGVIQGLYNQGHLTWDEARKLVSGELTPGDPTTFFDDADQLVINAVYMRDVVR